MPSKIKIKHPKKVTTSLWYASGLADDSTDTGIHGEFVDSAGTVHSGELLIAIVQRRGNGVRRLRWLILFNMQNAANGGGTLTVTGTVNQPDTKSVNVQLPALTKAKPPGSAELIGVDPSIEEGEEIPADGFVAFGTIVDHTVTMVTLNDIAADFVFEDPDTDTWAAQFPTLQPGTYKLRAFDSGDHLAVRNGLVVPP
jgi:hypothetical protein